MKTIVRIEHEDGWGMFRNKENRYVVGEGNNPIMDKLWDRHSTWTINGGMPVPSNDGIDMGLGWKEWFCAFKSMEQFNNWVKKDEAKELLKFNFKILLLEVTEYQEGGNQIVYTKESIVSERDISSLFE